MEKKHVCPWQAGNLLTLSARQLVHNPNLILEPCLSEGMTVMDVGCGMGYFTIPMAKITGAKGRVIAADLQQEMLDGMLVKAEKAGVKSWIEPRLCDETSLNITDLSGSVHFATIFMMLHEVPDQERLVREVSNSLKPGGKLLFAEPIVHVSKKSFLRGIEIFRRTGLDTIGKPRISFCRAVLFQKATARTPD